MSLINRVSRHRPRRDRAGLRAALLSALPLGSGFACIDVAIAKDPPPAAPAKSAAAAEDAPYKGPAIPTKAQILDVTIKRPEGLPPQLDRSSQWEHFGVVDVGNRLFIFPGYVAGPPTFTARRGGEPARLFAPDGRVASVPEGCREGIVTVRMLDVLRSRWADDARTAILKTVPDAAGRLPAWPDVPDVLEVQLCAKDPGQEGRPRTLAAFHIHRALGAAIHRLDFRVAGADLELLRHVTRDDVTIQVLQPYFCMFSPVDFMVNVRFVDENRATILDHLFSAPGSTAMLIATVGGSVDLKSALNAALRRSVRVTVSRNADSPDVDPGLVERLVFEAIQRGVTEPTSLAELRDDAVIKVLMSGISLTAPVGKLSELVERVKKDRERQSNDVRDALQRHSRELGVQTGGSIGMPGVAEASGKMDVQTASSDEEQSHEQRARLEHDLDELERAITGELPAVVAMRGALDRALTSWISADLEIAYRRFQYGRRTYTYSLSFQDADGDAEYDALKQQERALAARLEEARRAREEAEARLRAANAPRPPAPLYRIGSVGTPCVFDVPNGNPGEEVIQMFEWHNARHQVVEIIPVRGNLSKVRFQHSGLVLTTPDSVRVIQAPDTGADNQLWSFEPAPGPGGGFLIRSTFGKVLDIVDAVRGNHGALQCYGNAHADWNQRFEVIRIN